MTFDQRQRVKELFVPQPTFIIGRVILITQQMQNKKKDHFNSQLIKMGWTQKPTAGFFFVEKLKEKLTQKPKAGIFFLKN